MDIKKLQTAVGTAADGIIGINTYIAVFKRLGASDVMAYDLAVGANAHMSRYGIMDSTLRFSHFMGQLLHESGTFRYMEEIASGAAYEGRKDLGNIYRGDGIRFKGRGPIQITGRDNYRKFGRVIGIDIEARPELAAVPAIGLQLAFAYWFAKNLNDLADQDDIRGITRKINGGFNGLADRTMLVNKVKRMFA